MVRPLRPERLLFVSPWRPVAHDTGRYEGLAWECPTSSTQRVFSPLLARLEGAQHRLLLQCPACDHLAVVSFVEAEGPALVTEYGGPHVDEFIAFLDARSRREAREL